jgi:hypothetical protein
VHCKNNAPYPLPIKLKVHKEHISIAGSLFPLTQFQDFLLSCYPHLTQRFRTDFTPIRGKITEIDGDSVRTQEIDLKGAARAQYNWQGLLQHTSKQPFILFHFVS